MVVKKKKKDETEVGGVVLPSKKRCEADDVV